MATIKLLGNDGRTLEVDSIVVAKTMKITSYIDDEWGKIVPVRETSSETLAMVINFCVKKVEFDVNAANRDRLLVEHDRKIWNAGFFSVSQNTLFDLIVAAKHLGIDELFDEGCAAVGTLLKKKTADQIRDIFRCF